MGYQFLHIESYARTAGKGKAGGHTVGSVMAEATRQPDACPHVDVSQEPVHVFGVPVGEVEALATEWAANSVDAIGRKLRKDGLCLLAGVVSAPDDMSDADWSSMKRDTVEWLNRDGRLVSVVEHVDEAHRHIHFYKLPAPGERFDVLHPGRSAAAEAKAQGLVKGEQNKAYKAAMRGLQDDFFEHVGMRYGLNRLGPAKRRLTRSGWVAEQATMQALSKTIRTAEHESAVSMEAKAEARQMSHEAKAIIDEAEARYEKSEKQRKANVIFVTNWKKEKAQTQAKLERLGSFGGQVGSFVGRAFDAIKGVFSDRKAKEESQKQAVIKAQQEAKRAKGSAETWRDREASARLERDALQIDARNEIRRLAAERDAAQRALAQLNKPALSQKRQGPRMSH